MVSIKKIIAVFMCLYVSSFTALARMLVVASSSGATIVPRNAATPNDSLKASNVSLHFIMSSTFILSGFFICGMTFDFGFIVNPEDHFTKYIITRRQNMK